MAQQSLEGIKVVQTYGREELEQENFNEQLERAKDVSDEANRGIAVGMGFLSISTIIM